MDYKLEGLYRQKIVCCFLYAELCTLCNTIQVFTFYQSIKAIKYS